MNAPHIFKPNLEDISAHLHALFSPGFVHRWPDAEIEVVYGPPGVFTVSRWYPAFDLKAIVDFVEVRNAYGDNIYIGAVLRIGTGNVDRQQGGRPAQALRDLLADCLLASGVGGAGTWRTDRKSR